MPVSGIVFGSSRLFGLTSSSTMPQLCIVFKCISCGFTSSPGALKAGGLKGHGCCACWCIVQQDGSAAVLIPRVWLYTFLARLSRPCLVPAILAAGQWPYIAGYQLFSLAAWLSGRRYALSHLFTVADLLHVTAEYGSSRCFSIAAAVWRPYSLFQSFHRSSGLTVLQIPISAWPSYGCWPHPGLPP